MSNLNHHIRRLLARSKGTPAWRYWRVSILSHYDAGQLTTAVRTVGFFTDWSGGTNMALNPANAFGDDPGGSWPLSNCFDDSSSQCVWNRASFPVPIKIGYDFGTRMSLEDIPFFYWQGSNLQTNPKRIRVEGSNDLSTWDMIGEYYFSNIAETEYIWLAPPEVAYGEQLFTHTTTSGGAVEFIVPPKVSSVHIAVIAAGGMGLDDTYDLGGGGGGRAWMNNIRVFPGQSLFVTVEYPNHPTFGGNGQARITLNNKVLVRADPGDRPLGFGPGIGGPANVFPAVAPFINGQTTTNASAWPGGDAGLTGGQSGGHSIWPYHSYITPTNGAKGGYGAVFQAGGPGTIGIGNPGSGNAGANFGGGSRMGAVPGGGAAVICWGTGRTGFTIGGSAQYVTY